MDKFILTVYGQKIVTDDKYSSDTEPDLVMLKFLLQVAELEVQLHPLILSLTSLHQGPQPMGMRPSVLQLWSVSMPARPLPGTLSGPRGRMQRLLVHPPNLIQVMVEPSITTV